MKDKSGKKKQKNESLKKWETEKKNADTQKRHAPLKATIVDWAGKKC